MSEPVVALAQALADGSVGTYLASVRPGTGGRQSAVLALFTVDEVLLVQRSSTMRKHAGQVAFPGGAVEAGETMVEAALRETWEETGLDPAEVRVLGELPPTHIPVSSFDVTVVVGYWATPHPLVGGDAGEIASVTRVPLAELADPANRFTAVGPRNFASPGFEVGPLWIWGFTGFVLDELLQAAGVARAWNGDDRRPVPARLAG